MLLSNYILNTGVKPYLEYGWVTAPVDAAQVISAHTITTLTINTEIADTGNNGSISGNQITLAAGTYYFEANAPIGSFTAGDTPVITIGLYNVTLSQYISRSQSTQTNYSAPIQCTVNGQFTIASSSDIDLRAVGTIKLNHGHDYGNTTNATNTTAGADQRATVKLWKLA